MFNFLKWIAYVLYMFAALIESLSRTRKLKWVALAMAIGMGVFIRLALTAAPVAVAVAVAGCSDGCESNETRCSGTLVEVCNADQNWELIVDCKEVDDGSWSCCEVQLEDIAHGCLPLAECEVQLAKIQSMIDSNDPLLGRNPWMVKKPTNE